MTPDPPIDREDLPDPLGPWRDYPTTRSVSIRMEGRNRLGNRATMALEFDVPNNFRLDEEDAHRIALGIWEIAYGDGEHTDPEVEIDDPEDFDETAAEAADAEVVRRQQAIRESLQGRYNTQLAVTKAALEGKRRIPPPNGGLN